MAAFEDLARALRGSADRLAGVVDSLTPEQLRQQAYPSEWTVADVLSHLGSGAGIAQRRIEAARAGGQLEMPETQAIWDEWNAKQPEQQAADAVGADRSLGGLIESLTDHEASTLRLSMGPLDLDIAGLLGLVLNERAVHAWDIDVSLDPAATIAPDAVDLVVDQLLMIGRFAAKPTGADRAITIATRAPARAFIVTLTPEQATLAVDGDAAHADLTLPAEALIRLVYGRLDPDHTPPLDGEPADLDELRRVFPGV
jgi:uncharacterized protein (TIGR03083 family)